MGIEGLNGLAEKSNNQELSNLAQLTTSLGGVENLQQFLEQIAAQNEENFLDEDDPDANQEMRAEGQTIL